MDDDDDSYVQAEDQVEDAMYMYTYVLTRFGLDFKVAEVFKAFQVQTGDGKYVRVHTEKFQDMMQSVGLPGWDTRWDTSFSPKLPLTQWPFFDHQLQRPEVQLLHTFVTEMEGGAELVGYGNRVLPKWGGSRWKWAKEIGDNVR